MPESPEMTSALAVWLAGTFACAGAFKFADRHHFSSTVSALIPQLGQRSYAAGLAIASTEFVGAVGVAGLARVQGAVLLGILLSVSTVVLLIGRDRVPATGCGCFGQAGTTPALQHTVVRNVALLIAVVLVASDAQHALWSVPAAVAGCALTLTLLLAEVAGRASDVREFAHAD